MLKQCQNTKGSENYGTLNFSVRNKKFYNCFAQTTSQPHGKFLGLLQCQCWKESDTLTVTYAHNCQNEILALPPTAPPPLTVTPFQAKPDIYCNRKCSNILHWRKLAVTCTPEPNWPTRGGGGVMALPYPHPGSLEGKVNKCQVPTVF